MSFRVSKMCNGYLVILNPEDSRSSYYGNEYVFYSLDEVNLFIQQELEKWKKRNHERCRD